MLVGYARVSSSEQETTLQRDALKRAKVRQVFEEKRSATAWRPQLDAALRALEPGDVLVVYKVDRVARSLSDLLSILRRIEVAGAGFRSLTEPIDTSTPAGRLMLQLLGAFAEFERSMIRERSMAGQAAARERGATIGRPRSMTPVVEAAVVQMVESGAGLSEAARCYRVHLSSAKRAVLRARGRV
jgi:DNA invertase Pin-like site-specific DNA recombinase